MPTATKPEAKQPPRTIRQRADVYRGHARTAQRHVRVAHHATRGVQKQVAPFAGMGLLVLASAALSAAKDASAADTQILGGTAATCVVIAVVAAAQMRRRLDDRKSLSRGIAFLGVAGSWLTATTALGLSWNAVGLLAVLGTACSLHYLRNRRIPNTVPVEPVADAEPQAQTTDGDGYVARWDKYLGCPGGQLSGSMLESPKEVKAGWRFVLQLVPGKQSIASLMAVMALVRGGLGLTVDQDVIAERHPVLAEPAVQLTVVTKPQVREDQEWPGPQTFRDGYVDMGPFIDGEGHARWKVYTKDRMVGGYIQGGSGSGKALALDTRIPTPEGWVAMGDLQPGGRVFDEFGRVCNIVAATPVMRGRPCYEVEFSDGTVIVADAEHEWITTTQRGRKQRGRAKPESIESGACVPVDDEPVTTREIAETLLASRGRNNRPAVNHAVDAAGPLAYAKQDLPIAPYTFGAWLGDGSSNDSAITSADDEILEQIRLDGYQVVSHNKAYGYRFSNRPEFERRLAVAISLADQGVPVSYAARHVGIAASTVSASRPKMYGRQPKVTEAHRALGSASQPFLFLKGVLRRLGVFNNKHIPELYLRASVDQRRALLAGLMDTDGTCGKSGIAQLTVTNECLARDAFDLIVGLGYKATLRTKSVKGRTAASSTCYMVSFTPHDPVFRLARKLGRQRSVSPAAPSRRRYIVDVRPIPSVPVRCIEVDSPSHLYLASESCIPTHNSRLTESIVMPIADSQTHPTVFWYADGQGGSSSPTLMRHADFAARNHEQTKQMYGCAMLIMELRQDENSLAGDGDDEDDTIGFTPTVDRPGLLLVHDECHKSMSKIENPEDWIVIQYMAATIAREGQKVGVQAILASQESTLGAFGGAGNNAEMLRSNLLMGNGVMMRSKDANARQVFKVDDDPSQFPALPGYALLIDPEEGARSAPFRAYFLTDQLRKEWPARIRWRSLDGGSANAAGDAYVLRHQLAAMAKEEIRRRIAERRSGAHFGGKLEQIFAAARGSDGARQDNPDNEMPEVAQFPVWNPATGSVQRKRMHDGHRKILDALKAGVSSPTPIAEVTGYTSRRVHQLLDELMDDFGAVQRVTDANGRGKHGEYRLAEECADV